MSNTPVRTRSERVASLQMEPSAWRKALKRAFQTPVMLRLGLAVLFGLGIVVSMYGWLPPFAYRQGYIPPRTLVARVKFQRPDPTKTAILQDQKRREVLCLYENSNQPLMQLRDAVKNQVLRLVRNAKPLAELESDQREALDKFLVNTGEEPPASPDDSLQAIRDLLSEDKELNKFDLTLRAVFLPLEEHGLLQSLTHSIEEGNQRVVRVFPTGHPEEAVAVNVPRIRIVEASVDLQQRLQEQLRKDFSRPEAGLVAKMLSAYILPNLPTTLTFREDLSQKARQEAVNSVPTAMITYFPGVTSVAEGGKPLTVTDLELLRTEYDAWIGSLTFSEKLLRLISFSGMVAAMYMLCGIYIWHQFDRTLLTHTDRLIRLLGLVLATCVLASFMAQDPWRAEIVPLLLCAMTATIAYGRQVALLILSAVSLAVTLSLGFDLSELVILASGSCAAILLLGRIRTRTRLIYVGAITALMVVATSIGVGIMVGQSVGAGQVSDVPLGISDPNAVSDSFLLQLSQEAARQGVFTILAALLMTGLLPFVERLFGVQTDLSLLELGDASHPLLRQLAQRAPGTYNHSINVAAIAEAAADSIGAHGLLTRVGAYFHDIGKMFKPNYFVENQSQGANRHDSLQPAMSTLVIIAHVKDGADLARTHRLPKPIIDFIEQHHGTTLVEYFYRQAAKRCENDPNAEEVSEPAFRYPGPKPQTLEAAVLMLADTVESASRSLTEPTPSRIQNLVEEISMKKLLDGQFDQCGLTLRQLDSIKRSLVKSLTAIYHGRVKYPGQQTA